MAQAKALARRVARTRRSLAAALVSLSLELGYDKVSIRKLTECADVGYATFFRHFRGKDELATYTIRATTAEFMRAAQAAETLHEESLALYRSLDEHRDVCLFGLSLPRDHPALTPVWEEITVWMKELYLAREGTTIPLELSLNHLVNSVVELFRWWLTDGQDYSVEQMALIQSELVVRTTESVALEHRLKSMRDAAPELTEAPQIREDGASDDAQLKDNCQAQERKLPD